MKILGSILKGTGISMLLLTACVDDYSCSTLKFIGLISLWLASSVGLVLLGEYISNFRLEFKRIKK